MFFFLIIIIFIVLLYLIEFYFFYKKKILKKDVFYQYKKIYSDIKLRIYPKYFIKNNNEILPLSGISNSLTFNCSDDHKINQNKFIYQSDRFGFNNKDENWESKDIKLLLTGDSIPQGKCTYSKDTISFKLDKKNYRNINICYAGNGPLLQYASIKEYFSKVKPDSLIWFFNERQSFLELLFEKNNPILKSYYLKNFYTQFLSSNQTRIDEIANLEMMNILKKKKYQKIKMFIKLYFTRNFSFLKKENKIFDYDFKNEIFLFKKIMYKTKNFLVKQNSNLLFIFLSTPVLNKKIKDDLKSFFDQIDIEYLDIDEKLKKKEIFLNPYVFDNGIYDAKINDYITDEIINKLSKG